MLERSNKPFLTIETGEAYQPIRLAYRIQDKQQLLTALNQLQCLKSRKSNQTWDWQWQHECKDLCFETHDSHQKASAHPLRLGTLTIRQDQLYISLPSFKRACLAVSFFHNALGKTVTIRQADFVNKVFATDERVAPGVTELFKDEDLESALKLRAKDYETVLKHCEKAKTAEEALVYLSDYTDHESRKRLPYSERYEFQQDSTEQNPEVLYLGFYIYLRSRELVAIRRWFGNNHYSLSDAAEEAMTTVFGDLGIDIIE